MPEYSSTTITPSDGVQVPGMNGSTSGNFLLSALKSYILSEKGLANGLASLDGNGKLTASQLPDLADDVIVVSSYATLPATGTAGKIYITADTNKGYRWDPELTTPGYVKIFEIDKSIVFGYYSSGSFYEDSEHTVQITPVEHVLYVDVSLADIYVLNDGTLIELLGTKWAKITDIQDGTIQAGIAVKAFQDAMGRAIITTYATKAELSAEESSREAADSNLKDALTATNKRVENLEEAHGSYHEVDVKSVYTIPSGKGSNWLIDGLRGVSRARNQLNGEGGYYAKDTYTTVTNSNYNHGFRATVSSERSFCQVNKDSYYYAGHTYCMIFKIDTSAEFQQETNTQYVINNSSGILQRVYFTPVKGQNAIIWTQERDSGGFFGQFQIYFTTNGASLDVTDIYVTDLTLYFNGSIPSDADTIAEIQTSYPWLLTPSSYGTSAVNTVYEGVRSKSPNVVDESDILNATGATKNGDYYSLTSIMYGRIYLIDSKAWSIFKPNTRYAVSWKGYCGSGVNARILFVYTDGTTSDISFFSTTESVQTGVSTEGKSIDYISFDYSTGGSLSFKELMVNEGTTALPYSKFGTIATLTFPTPVSLKSAGAVAEEYYPESGEVTHPIGQVDLGTLSWAKKDHADLGTYYYASAQDLGIAKPDSYQTGTANLLCAKYVPTKRSVSLFTDKSVCLDGDAIQVIQIQIKDSAYSDATAFKASLSGVMLYYELATPDPDTYVDPILNNLIKTESGGTIESILTNPVDDSMTLGYINL